MQIIVLGMHRSGTSAITRIINMMGAYAFGEGEMFAASRQNMKGYWERQDVVLLNRQLFAAVESDWQCLGGFDASQLPHSLEERYRDKVQNIIYQLDSHRPWVVKDPRLCILFPLWKPLLEVPVIIHVFRNPHEVARSLYARNSMKPELVYALYEKYIIEILRGSRDIPHIRVSFNDLMAKPIRVVSRLYKQLKSLGVTGLRLPGKREITAFIDYDQYRQRGKPEDAQMTYSKACWLYDQLNRRSKLSVELDISEESLKILREHSMLIDIPEENDLLTNN